MDQKPDKRPQAPHAPAEVKLVAEMPEDKEIQENLEEMKKNDGYPGSCGI
ncbi:hypothetical protein MJA45_16445 [Paenibacillus aurantius]|uniref:Uncharacterized protein n=1 Tax=Paenibacillus aurantius TaxID=2918900 RepID=A0AA96L9X5_9BACL|nr:hypothetical protein [Paenibacillus aurantius]WJH34153.1 hypothetical protein N6H14_30180 [Paenibacillus sp. CC-CFT747]WNQ09229.1 hypothetical protein MJA45_16445 [Paenibacillus aurantius]